MCLAADRGAVSDPVRIPGAREVVGRLDAPDADRVVVACPPHPSYGGSRSDPRLRAVSDALAPEVACLRFDYGERDGRETDRSRGERTTGAVSRGETVDAERALSWARDRFASVGLFGYSFGAGVALGAAARADAPLDACSVLAPPGDAVAALSGVDCPLQVVVGERDETVEWGPVADRAAEMGHAVERVPSTHRFRRDREAVAVVAAAFLSRRR